MTQTSNAAAVKSALITALRLVPALSGVQVAYSRPRDLARECVYLGRTTVHQEITSGRDASGNAGRREVATIDVHIRVSAVGQDEEAAEARAIVLGAAVEAYLAVNMPTVTALLAMDTSGFESDTYADDDGAYALVTYPVVAESHLS